MTRRRLLTIGAIVAFIVYARMTHPMDFDTTLPQDVFACEHVEYASWGFGYRMTCRD